MTPAELSEVEAVNAAFYAAVEHADPAAMADLWDADRPDDVTCVHPGWPLLRGRAQVLRSWSAIMAGTEDIHFLLTDVTVAVDGDTALVTCTENILSGGDGGVGAAATTNIFRRRAAGWRLQVHHASPLLTRPLADGQP